MQALRAVLLSVAFMVGWTAAAHAGPLVSASFALDFAWFPTLTFPGAGATGTATSNASTALGAGGFAGTQTSIATPTPSFPADVIQAFVTGNGGGTFIAGTNDLVGTATFSGKALLFPTTQAFPDSTFLSIPLAIGKSTVFGVNAAGIAMTVFGNPWRAGTAMITGITSPGGATKITLNGNNALTPGGAGVLTLVAPGKVYVCTGNKMPVIGTLTLNFVPEPGTFLLLGTGVALLRVLGRRVGGGSGAPPAQA